METSTQFALPSSTVPPQNASSSALSEPSPKSKLSSKPLQQHRLNQSPYIAPAQSPTTNNSTFVFPNPDRRSHLRPAYFFTSTVPARSDQPLLSWKSYDRVTTMHGALVLCLNIGVDPPDVLKPSHCADLHAWLRPNPNQAHKSIQSIGIALQNQYERWFLPRGNPHFQLVTDANISDLRLVCASVRRAARHDRVLFHYNGHGVPRPTSSGHIWALNQQRNGYASISLSDLHNFFSSPTLYVLDCHSAGALVHSYCRLLNEIDCRDRDRELSASQARAKLTTLPPHRHNVFLAACEENQLLPVASHLPSDLFTSCLTTPIKTALRWFSRRSIRRDVTDAMLDRIPGDVNVRSTPLGELDHILTTVTDAIAWNVLPRDLFNRLYRQDLLLAVLMRNFLLAQRIMGSFGCSPVSYPSLPNTRHHHLWQSFDVAMENLFTQLSTISGEQDHGTTTIAKKQPHKRSDVPSSSSTAADQPTRKTVHSSRSNFVGSSTVIASSHRKREKQMKSPSALPYQRSTFFEDHMKAFSVWLDVRRDSPPPEQLPMMLQVLFSSNRPQGLSLISRYMQTGPSAVDHTCSVGAFPYLIRLLDKYKAKAFAEESGYQGDLIFIWSKILAYDDTCQGDLVNSNADLFFLKFLLDTSGDAKPVVIASAFFVLSVLARKHPARMCSCYVLDACKIHLTHHHALVRRWSCLCLTEIFTRAENSTQVLELSSTSLVQTLRSILKDDPEADVRAAAVSTVSVLLGISLKHMIDKIDSNPNFAKIIQARSSHTQPSTVHRKSPTTHSYSSGPNLSPVNIGTQTSANANCCANAGDSFRVNTLSAHLKTEWEGILEFGADLTDVACHESSALVRREVALGISALVRDQQHKFVPLSLESNIFATPKLDENEKRSFNERKDIYKALWNVISELACDPHPVVAAIAWRTFGLVTDAIEQTALTINSGNPIPKDVLMVDDNCGSHQRPTFNDTKVISTQSRIYTYIGKDCSCSQSSSHIPSVAQLPPTQHSIFLPSVGKQEPNISQPAASENRIMRNIHVKSVKGSFDFGILFEAEANATHSISHGLHEGEVRVINNNILKSQMSTESDERTAQTCGRTSSLQTNTENRNLSDAEARSLLYTAIMKGLENMLKTVSKHPTASNQCSFPSTLSGSQVSPGRCRVDSQSAMDKNQTNRKSSYEEHILKSNQKGLPPRPHKETVCYHLPCRLSFPSGLTEQRLIRGTQQVRNKTVEMSLSSQSGHARSGKSTSEKRSLQTAVPSDDGTAFSLYEWSSFYLRKAKFDCEVPDYVDETESFARLWCFDHPKDEYNQNNSHSEEDFDDTDTGNDTSDRKGTAQVQELGRFDMAAGGGAISALSFLPKGSGMGSGHLVVTGDTNGSLGVYNVSTGKCQASFGIPIAPGMQEVGISSIVCNPYEGNNPHGYGLSSKRTALILAGAYDGRVAVFHSGPFSAQCRMLSTFQASGKAGRRQAASTQIPFRTHFQNEPNEETTLSTHNICENYGLQMDFNATSGHLVAGGCDGAIVRVWDLTREQCIWSDAVAKPNVIPTAVTMLKKENQNVFLVGGSNGGLHVVDIRERIEESGSNGNLLGQHENSILHLDTLCDVSCNNAGWCGEKIVSADCNGDLVIWDLRWHDVNWRANNSSRETVYHEEGMTTMCIRHNGRYIGVGSTNGVNLLKEDSGEVTIEHHLEMGSGVTDEQNSNFAVTALGFQEEYGLLAAGCSDGRVVVCGKRRDLYPNALRFYQR